MENITIEQLEALATSVIADDAAERTRLRRLITAYARILSIREPGVFKRRATVIADKDGHWDNSYPPEIKCKDFSGPRLLHVYAYCYDEIATSGGFYYSWRAATSDAGLYVARDGQLYGASIEGTGRVGQFAAHPGNCDVDLTVEWETLDDDIAIDRLSGAEQKLRKLAFPLIAATEGK